MHLVINLAYTPNLLEAQIGLSSLFRNSKSKLQHYKHGALTITKKADFPFSYRTETKINLLNYIP